MAQPGNDSAHGNLSWDWIVTMTGDGFEPQIDPENPDILYAHYQCGGLARFDRRSVEMTYILPQPEPGEALRWNWVAALLLSPHSPTRLYLGDDKLFRSDDRGDSWRAVPPDLTPQLDRDRLPVMGRVWSVDAVARGGASHLAIVSFKGVCEVAGTSLGPPTGAAPAATCR